MESGSGRIRTYNYLTAEQFRKLWRSSVTFYWVIFFEPPTGIEPMTFTLQGWRSTCWAKAAIKIIYCFTSAVQQTKRHSSRELLGGFNQTHHQFPLTRDHDSSTWTTAKPFGCTLQKARSSSTLFEALCTSAKNCYIIGLRVFETCVTLVHTNLMLWLALLWMLQEQSIGRNL